MVASTLLREAADVPSAIQVLNQSLVVNKPSIAQGLTKGCHWGIADKEGRSVVVEYIGGEMHVHNNTVGVMTNDPPFQWHLLNLNTYVNLQNSWPSANSAIQMDSEVDVVPRTIGHGWNLAGLPGDSSPPSRFVRLFYLRGYATAAHRGTTMEDAIIMATGLINNVFLISGTVAREAVTDGYEYTPFAVLKLPAEKVFMYRSYTDMQWKSVNLNQLDFSGTEYVNVVIPPSELNIKDVTSQFGQ